MLRWVEFSAAAPALAAFGAERLRARPAYLATTRGDGTPRVHPVSPIISDTDLMLFMEPTSPKGRDLRERDRYALHSGVIDSFGTGGEFMLRGRAAQNRDPAVWATAAAAAGYDPPERYILFELWVTEARANGYGDVELPEPGRWVATPQDAPQ